MSVEELVKRLRHNYEMWALGSKGPPILVEAADKLEELAAENKRLKRELSATVAERNRAQEACQQISENTEAALAEAKRENEALREALTPSGDTKAAYMGEFSFPYPIFNADGDEIWLTPNVPWTTIKEIMKAIAERARNAGGNDAE